MPHGKQYDLPYPPETLGIADATETENRAEISLPGQAPSRSHAEDAHTAAAATARSSLLPGGDQDASGDSISATLLQQDHQQQHRQGQQDTQQGQQQQSGPSSHMAQANQHQPHQQQQHECQQGVTHEHQQDQRQHQQQAICGSGSVQLGNASAAADLGQQVSGSAGQQPSALSSPRAEPANANQSSQALWAPWADFDVHSVLEVACMKLLPNFLVDMARVGDLPLSCMCACMQCMHVLSAIPTCTNACAK